MHISVELKVKNARVFVWPLSLRPYFSFYLLHFLSSDTSFTSPEVSFLLSLVSPVHLDLVIILCTSIICNWDLRPNGNMLSSWGLRLLNPQALPSEGLFQNRFQLSVGAWPDHKQPTKADSHLFYNCFCFSKKGHLCGFLCYLYMMSHLPLWPVHL